MILHTILSQLAPYECLGCGIEGKLICQACTNELPDVPPRCYRCQRLTNGGKTCQSCRASSDLYAVQARTIYTGIAKELIWRLKFSGVQSAAHEMARLCNVDLPEGAMLVPVPTASSRVRQRGYDQAKLFARTLARQYEMAYLAVLRRVGQQHQVGATRQQRVTQLADAYRCVRPSLIKGRHIILVDDVLTTGSTLEAAAKVMKNAGATRVSGLVFAQA